MPGLPLRDKAWKLLYLAYYPLLWNRKFPGSARLAAGIRAFEMRTGRGDAPVARAAWEEQYRAGTWDFLRGRDELARYAVLVGYLQALRPGGSVLDVGCGDGQLRERLRPLGYSRFVGVDLAAAAIARAAAVADPQARFVAADAELWSPPAGELFDAIVFNECLYYFDRPVATAVRYQRHLQPGGLLLVSMFESRRSRAIARDLRAAWSLLEEVRVRHAKGTWIIGLYAAHGADAPPRPLAVPARATLDGRR